MSGHSKWAQIKRQKGATDQKRGQTFTKLGHAISVAAREKGGDPTSNFTLRLAIERARAANMPKENIERAIKRGTGELGGAQIEELTYEGYGPEGVALLIHAVTDNKNRALNDIKTAVTRHGGKLASAGAVAYLFKPVGHIRLALTNFDQQFEQALEAGAEDIYTEGEELVIETAPTELQQVRQALESRGEKLLESELTEKAQTTAELSEAGQEQLLRLEDALHELDDVVKVTDNVA